MDLKIKNKNAIICASSKGLGYASALALAKEGVNVTINGRSQESLIQAKKNIELLTHANVKLCKADLSLPIEQEKLFQVCHLN